MTRDEHIPMDDHAWIDDQQIAERYVLGRLSEAEAERFEEHYLSCPPCLGRVEAAEGLHHGLARVAAEDVAAVSTGWAALLTRWSRSRALPWVASVALLVMVLLPSGYLVFERGELAQQLEQSRSEAARIEAQARDRAFEIGELESRVHRWQEEAAAERRRREALSRRIETSREPKAQPSGNTAIVTLGPERSAAAEPSVELTLPEDTGWVVFALEVEPPEAPSYRVTLEDPAGGVVWRGSGLVADALGTVNLSVPAEILAPGIWSLRLTAEPPGEPPTSIGRFQFRIRTPEGGRP